MATQRDPADRRVLRVLASALASLGERGKPSSPSSNSSRCDAQGHRLRDARWPRWRCSPRWRDDRAAMASASSSRMRSSSAGFYLGSCSCGACLLAFGGLVLGRARGRCSAPARPVLLAFSTATSEAAYPRTLEALRPLRRAAPDRELRPAAGLLVQPRRLDDVLHLRDPVHRAGLRHRLPSAQQTEMVLMLMITSKGIAGVPRASLVVIAAVMGQFHIPEAGLLLILARRSLPRHGPQRDQRRRQRGRERRSGEVGGRTGRRAGRRRRPSSCFR